MLADESLTRDLIGYNILWDIEGCRGWIGVEVAADGFIGLMMMPLFVARLSGSGWRRETLLHGIDIMFAFSYSIVGCSRRVLGFSVLCWRKRESVVGKLLWYCVDAVVFFAFLVE